MGIVNPINVQPSFREQPRALSFHERVTGSGVVPCPINVAIDA